MIDVNKYVQRQGYQVQVMVKSTGNPCSNLRHEYSFLYALSCVAPVFQLIDCVKGKVALDVVHVVDFYLHSQKWPSSPTSYPQYLRRQRIL